MNDSFLDNTLAELVLTRNSLKEMYQKNTQLNQQIQVQVQLMLSFAEDIAELKRKLAMYESTQVDKQEHEN
jgi:hypothetical protein